MVQVNVYNAKGEAKGKVELPPAFETPLRPDVIRKAVSVARANRRQRYGAAPMAGTRHAEHSAGKGRGMSRVPRQSQGNKGVLAPSNVGGRRAHPPEARRDWSEKINSKERRLAIASALAATADPEAVRARGHRFKDGLTLPVVVEDALGAIQRTSEALEALDKLGLADDVARAHDGHRQRPGIGKLRGRRYKTPKSLLLVTAGADGGRGFRNLLGVDVIEPRELNAEHLAPGGDPGRLTVFTRSALDAVAAAAAKVPEPRVRMPRASPKRMPPKKKPGER